MRLRTHRLWLASLLLVAGLSTRVGAKPPDLPVQTEDQFTPLNGPVVTPPVAEESTVPPCATMKRASDPRTLAVSLLSCVQFRRPWLGLMAGAALGQWCASQFPTYPIEPEEDLRQIQKEWIRGGIGPWLTTGELTYENIHGALVDDAEGVAEAEKVPTSGGAIIVGGLKKLTDEPAEECEDATPCPNVPKITTPCRPCRPCCPATGDEPYGVMQLKIKIGTTATGALMTGVAVEPRPLLDDDVMRDLAAKLFEQAQRYVNAGQYAEALQVYATVRCVCPNTPYETQAIGCMNAVSAMMSEKCQDAEASEPVVPAKPAVEECPYWNKKSAQPLSDVVGDEPASVVENIEKVEKAAQLYKKAEEMLHEGDCERAAIYYTRIRKLVPGSRYDQMAADRLAGLEMPKSDNSATEEVVPLPGDSEDSSIEARETRLQKWLDLPTNWNFNKCPLADCVEDINSLSGLKIALDKRALDEEGVSSRTPVTICVTNVSFNEALDKLCKQVGLSKMIKDGTVTITTLTSRRVAEGPVVTACYDISDLIKVKSAKRKGGKRKPAELSEQDYAEKLIKVLTTSIQPNTWADAGGIGSIEFYPLTKSLVVNHTAVAQEQVEELLSHLRESPTWRTRTVKAKETAAEPTVKLVPHLPDTDPTIVQAYEQILEMAPPRLLNEPLLHTESSEPPMTWVPLNPLTPCLTDADVRRLTLTEEECELEVVTEDGTEASEAPVKDTAKTLSCCIDLDLKNARGRRMQIQLQMGRLNLRLVRDVQGHGSFVVDYSITKE